ncbi:MAG: NAD-dependent epimerase/dehydratase family protein [Acidobacteria bacterium]|nr:NAD-dependent epimerase/dehydratase family protein [Acidobacteriota bacterium]MCI0626369.1 NAD-dependent epimerase/dehydratase family protein [Acidobacteriota bacterium]MCI0720700.1 NAD-dependent epimerase/dehydratase family protein [Acidobacteriota bacterium]
MARVLIAGCGYVGITLGIRLAADGHAVWGLRRRPARLPNPIYPIGADLRYPSSLRQIPSGIDFVFYTAAAERQDDASYQAIYVDGVQNLLTHLHVTGQQPKRCFFTSSTAVYAQAAGEWVDETSETRPQEFSRRRLLEGERLLLQDPFPATIVRMAGIYGPGRARLIDQVRRGEAVCYEGESRYTNRIHRDDCAGVLQHMMSLTSVESLYLGADHEPASQVTVLRWLAERLGAPAPRLEPGAPLAGGKRQGNKRCRNARLLQSGYVLRYPTFREGYEAILAAEGPRPP